MGFSRSCTKPWGFLPGQFKVLGCLFEIEIEIEIEFSLQLDLR
jgi:hypothetical protein